MADIGNIELDLKVVIGEAEMPLAKFLQLGRGSVIKLDPPKHWSGEHVDAPLTLEANGTSVGTSQLVLRGEDIAVEFLG